MKSQKKITVRGKREIFGFGTQRNLYSTDLRLRFGWGNEHFRFGIRDNANVCVLDTNMLVSSKRNYGVGGLD